MKRRKYGHSARRGSVVESGVHVSEDINYIPGNIFHNTVENNLVDPVKIVGVSKIGSR